MGSGWKELSGGSREAASNVRTPEQQVLGYGRGAAAIAISNLLRQGRLFYPSALQRKGEIVIRSTAGVAIILTWWLGSLGSGCAQHEPVPNTPGQEPKKPGLANEIISFELNPETGTLQSLNVVFENEGYEFMIPESQTPDFTMGTISLGYRRVGVQDWTFHKTTKDKATVSHEQGSRVITVTTTGPNLPYNLIQRYELPQDQRLEWGITLENPGTESLEIGELSLALPFNNNYYTDFDQSPEGMERLFHSRFYIHRYIGGASSYLLIRKLDGTFPGLLVLPTSGTGFEFFHNNLVGWEGIPQVYLFSKATKERLRLAEDWLNGHTSVTLSPGQSKTFTLALWPILGRHHYYGYEDMFARSLEQILYQEYKVHLQGFPSMVVPTDSYALMVAKSRTPIKDVTTTPLVQIDKGGGSPSFRLIRFQPEKPGPLTLGVETESGEVTKAHYLIVEPITELIKKRAAFIAKYQFYDNPAHLLDGAILVYNNKKRQPLVAPATYWGGGGYEGGITDAMFLAAKNAIHPDLGEIQILEQYVERFLLKRLQNPGDHRVAWFFYGKTPMKMGRPYNYCHNLNFHYWMYRIGKDFQLLKKRSAADYLDSAYKTAVAMFSSSWTWHLYNVGLMHYSGIYDVIEALKAEGRVAEAATLEALAIKRANSLLSSDYPYSAEPLYDTTGYEDVYFAGKLLENYEHLERTARCALTQKSYSPTWFWNGSDKRYWDAMEDNPQSEYYGSDNGETCFHYTAPQTALVGLTHYDSDRFFPEKMLLFKSYASLLGVWSLVHSDGSASMCYTPDVTSNHAGYNQFSGDVGLGLFGYLRAVRSYLDSNRYAANFTLDVPLGCNLIENTDDYFTVKIIDGVGRRFSIPNSGLHITLECGLLDTLTLTKDYRSLKLVIKNPAPVKITPRLTVEGLWGQSFDILTGGKQELGKSEAKALVTNLELPANGELELQIRSTL